jgi:hypothetical protein
LPMLLFLLLLLFLPFSVLCPLSPVPCFVIPECSYRGSSPCHSRIPLSGILYLPLPMLLFLLLLLFLLFSVLCPLSSVLCIAGIQPFAFFRPLSPVLPLFYIPTLVFLCLNSKIYLAIY